MGVPGKLKRQVTDEERVRFLENLQHYIEKAELYRQELQNGKNEE
jgi:carbonic anhydrase/acetyltransferase-like protein (isoleucine patch superfamily)